MKTSFQPVSIQTRTPSGSTKQALCAVNTLIDKNKLPHLLLYGPPGTGKTSTIIACAKRLYGEKYKGMIMEVRGIPTQCLHSCLQLSCLAAQCI